MTEPDCWSVEPSLATALTARRLVSDRINAIGFCERAFCRLRIPGGGRSRIRPCEAPVTHGLLREAGLSLLPIQGTQWTVEDGRFSREQCQDSHEPELHKALQELKPNSSDGVSPVPSTVGYGIAHGQGLRRGRPGAGQHLGAWGRMDGWRTEYAGPHNRRLWRPRRISDRECRNHDVAMHLGSAIEVSNGRRMVRCTKGQRS